MVADPPSRLSPDHMRNLLHALGSEMDLRFAALRKGTGYEHVRPSDVRVFGQTAIGVSTISDIARALRISRQAAHMSARRLQTLGVIEIAAAANKRDRILRLTEKGREAAGMAQRHTATVDDEFAEVIGSDGVETLRKTLKILLQKARADNERDGLRLLE